MPIIQDHVLPVTTDENKNKKSILFVCTGNTCRSPMAAALFNDIMRGRMVIHADSAGLYAATGTPITPLATEALLDAGIVSMPDNDYLSHRARAVTLDLMTADEIVAISGAHAMELMLRFPECAGKITTLSKDIPDPFGKDLQTYKECLATMRACIISRWLTGDSL